MATIVAHSRAGRQPRTPDLEGGVGAGTLHRFKLTAGKRVREYVMRVDEPEPGRVITETDQDSSLVTSFTVTPDGDSCRVEIRTQGSGSV